MICSAVKITRYGLQSQVIHQLSSQQMFYLTVCQSSSADRVINFTLTFEWQKTSQYSFLLQSFWLASILSFIGFMQMSINWAWAKVQICASFFWVEKIISCFTSRGGGRGCLTSIGENVWLKLLSTVKTLKRRKHWVPVTEKTHSGLSQVWQLYQQSWNEPFLNGMAATTALSEINDFGA